MIPVTDEVLATDEIISFDPYSHAIHDDPYPHYKKLRDHAPAYWNEKYGFWLLSRYEDVKMAFRNFKAFSNREGVALESDMTAGAGYPMLLTMDPPSHTKQRKVISKLLTPSKVEALEDYVRQKAQELLEGVGSKGQFDILSDFAVYLPTAVIAKMLKVPAEDEDKVRIWTDTLVSREEGQFEVPDEAITAYFELAGYMDALIKKEWDSEADESLISAIIQAEKSGDLTHDEVIGFMILLGVAGNETTTKLIGNFAYRLWQHKDQRQKLVDDPSLISAAIEEVVRFDGSTQLLGRTVVEDITLHGKTLKAGDRVGLLIISANRDERKYENAEQFDITRNARDHIGFGFGIHACVGAILARMEVRIAFEEILKVMPDYDIEADKLTRMHSPNVRGFTSIPVRFTPSAV